MVEAAAHNAQIVLSERPEGKLEEGNFTRVVGAIPEVAEGEVLARTILLSLDPANRAWMNGRTYRDQVAAGQVMSGFTLSEVVDANGTSLAAGTVIAGEAGWQQYAALPVSAVEPVTLHGPLTHHMSVLGITGLTAYFGLQEIGRPQPGETVVVSAAGGATGNVVGQLARIQGARVVGSSGSDEKNRLLEEELGFDATVNHRDADLRGALKSACPNGIDVYFDNVAGPVLNAVLPRMNEFGRIVCCGSVSDYDSGRAPAGPPAVPGVLIARRLRMQGFIVLDYAERFAEATARLAELVREGKLLVLEEVLDGLESAPEGLIGLLAGDNIGKRLVRVGPDPAPDRPR